MASVSPMVRRQAFCRSCSTAWARVKDEAAARPYISWVNSGWELNGCSIISVLSVCIFLAEGDVYRDIIQKCEPLDKDASRLSRCFRCAAERAFLR